VFVGPQGVVIYLEQGGQCVCSYGLADATAVVSCLVKIQNGFTFLVSAHPGSSEKEAINVNGCFIEGLLEVTVLSVEIFRKWYEVIIIYIS